MITAKIKCNVKQEFTVGDQRYATLGFMPDYADGRNKEWSVNTPHLDLRMTVVGDVGDRFELGDAYTLRFAVEE